MKERNHVQVRVTHVGITARDRALKAKLTQAIATARHHSGPGSLDKWCEPGIDTLVRAVVADV
jgi:hypothetical protein